MVDRAALYVRSLSGPPVDATVAQLVGRLCEVADLHIAVRPPMHVFAIVVVRSSADAFKCAKAFNNATFDGRRLRVEPAKRYFMDTLREEWSRPAETPAVRPSVPCEPFSSSVVRIRRAKHSEPLVVLCGAPDPSHPHALPCGRRTRFSYDDSFVLQESLPVWEPPARAVEAVEVVEAEAVRVPSSASRPAEGGGVRRGFGSLRTVAAALLEPVLEKKKQWSFDAGLGEESGEPSVSAADLEPAALERERLRAKAILDSLVSPSAVPSVVPSKRPRRTDAEAPTGGVDLGHVRRIFGREGGVWFGDTGLDETVLRGQADPLFLAAERMGLDVRDRGPPEDRAMRFGFFGADEEDPAAGSHQTDAGVAGSSGAGADTTEPVRTAPVVQASLESVLATALLFRRDRCGRRLLLAASVTVCADRSSRYTVNGWTPRTD